MVSIHEISDEVIQANDVAEAHPRIVEAVENMIKKGKWTVPGMFILFYFELPGVNGRLRLQGEIW